MPFHTRQIGPIPALKPSHRTNHLAYEQSLYLQQNACSPVKWYPWGEEASAEARKRRVSIFLSIGYSTSHLCHVVDVEIFGNENVAKLLNDSFVSIKVDREERPDVAMVYIKFLQFIQNYHGWPLGVFLSHDLIPFLGASHFRPTGFENVLRYLINEWDDWKDIIIDGGDYAFGNCLKALSTRESSSTLHDELLNTTLSQCKKQLASMYQPTFRGLRCDLEFPRPLASMYKPTFGGLRFDSEFPRPVEIQFMLYHLKRLVEARSFGEANEVYKIMSFTLRRMAEWGIHDHIGGGFHKIGSRSRNGDSGGLYKYSMDEFWLVPHFEKMLYDQGQLALVYLDAFSFTNDPFYSGLSRDILDFMRRDMIGENGEIFSAVDADSAEVEGARSKEGAFYLWTTSDVEHVLEENDATLFKSHYSIQLYGNCVLPRMCDPHNEFMGKNVLFEREDPVVRARERDMSVSSYLHILGRCRKTLYEHRLGRPRPHVDKKVIVSWNGLAISSFARASKILKGEAGDIEFTFPVEGCDPEEYIKVAEKAAHFIREHLYDERACRLKHCFFSNVSPSKVPGFLDDYAFLISGLLDLYEFGGGIEWLIWATQLQDTQDKLFLDREVGGYYNTTDEDKSVKLRVKEGRDGEEPSGNSVSAINLVRLASMMSGRRSRQYKETMKHLLAYFQESLKKTPTAMPLMCCAADMLSMTWKKVVLVGRNPCVDMFAAAHANYNLNTTVIHIDPTRKKDRKFWKKSNKEIATLARNNVANEVVALVCVDCKHPVLITDPSILKLTLDDVSLVG